MTAYEVVKWLHVLSAAILLGTGAGIAFFTWQGYRWCRKAGDLPALARILELTVVADWIFTAPTVLFQFASGLYLLSLMGAPLLTVWMALVTGLYLLAGICWIPVIWIQYQLRSEARAASSWNDLSPRFARLFRYWFWLGVPAFAAVIALYAIMISKPWFLVSLTP